MKGISNRQKMIVAPREHIDKRTLTTQKIKSKQIVQNGKVGMQKSKFKRKTF